MLKGPFTSLALLREKKPHPSFNDTDHHINRFRDWVQPQGKKRRDAPVRAILSKFMYLKIDIEKGELFYLRP